MTFRFGFGSRRLERRGETLQLDQTQLRLIAQQVLQQQLHLRRRNQCTGLRVDTLRQRLVFQLRLVQRLAIRPVGVGGQLRLEFAQARLSFQLAGLGLAAPGVESFAALGQRIDYRQQVEQAEKRQADRIGQPLLTWGERSPPQHHSSKGAIRHRLLRHVRRG